MAEKTIVGYDVTVRGTYYGANGKDREVKTFGPITFFIPETVEIPNGKKRIETKGFGGTKIVKYEAQTTKKSVTTPNVALYVVQRQLLPAWLEENKTGVTSFRTCSIVPNGLKRVVRPAKDAISVDKPVAEMNVAELKVYAKLKDLNVPVEAFVDLESAREMVEVALEEKTKKPAVSTTDTEDANTPVPEDAEPDDSQSSTQDPAEDLV